MPKQPLEKQVEETTMMMRSPPKAQHFVEKTFWDVLSFSSCMDFLKE